MVDKTICLFYYDGGVVMYTEFGKALRHIRLDNFENMKDMAQKLDVSTSFLSAVEVGKKNIPAKWVDEISQIYNLDENQQKELQNAFDITQQKVSLNLDSMDKDQQNVSLMFARSIKNIDPNTLEKLRELLEQEEKK